MSEDTALEKTIKYQLLKGAPGLPDEQNTLPPSPGMYAQLGIAIIFAAKEANLPIDMRENPATKGLMHGVEIVDTGEQAQVAMEMQALIEKLRLQNPNAITQDYETIPGTGVIRVRLDPQKEFPCIEFRGPTIPLSASPQQQAGHQMVQISHVQLLPTKPTRVVD